jgi:hypothetical protein
MSPVGAIAGFIGGAIVTLIAMTLVVQTRQSTTRSRELRDPEPATSDERSSPSQQAEQSFRNKHSPALVGLAGGVIVASITAVVTIQGTLATIRQQERSGELQYQSDLVLRALEPDDVDDREEQLRFLLDTQLLTDEEIRDGLTAYLKGNDLPQFGPPASAMAAMGQAMLSDQMASRLGCHPSYEPCVPNASDADCLGSAGDGPAYARQVKVIGPDVFELDTDANGTGCDEQST